MGTELTPVVSQIQPTLSTLIIVTAYVQIYEPTWARISTRTNGESRAGSFPWFISTCATMSTWALSPVSQVVICRRRLLHYEQSLRVCVPEDLYAGTSQDLEDSNGPYLVPFARVSSDPGMKECVDEELWNKLWGWLEKECEV